MMVKRLKMAIKGKKRGVFTIKPIQNMTKEGAKLRENLIKSRKNSKVVESFELRMELKCPKCDGLQTYHLKKIDKMQCRRCGTIF